MVNGRLARRWAVGSLILGLALAPVGGVQAAAAPDALVTAVNANAPERVSGSRFDAVQLTAPTACNNAATRHLTTIVAVRPLRSQDSKSAREWVGDNLYATSSVGLPGPLTVRSNGNWQQLADAYGQKLVPGTYVVRLRCQDNLGTQLYEQWRGDIKFTSATAWRGFSTVSASGTEPVTPMTPVPTAAPTGDATAAAPGQGPTASARPSTGANGSAGASRSPAAKRSTGAKPSASSKASTGAERSSSAEPPSGASESPSASNDAAFGAVGAQADGGSGKGLASTGASVVGFGLLGLLLGLALWMVVAHSRRRVPGATRLPR
jgi:hypothetical protein